MLRIEEAIEIVLELARENILTESDARENDLEKERDKQFDACGVIEDFFVNVVFKDEEE